jgi:hypothetical protein
MRKYVLGMLAVIAMTVGALADTGTRIDSFGNPQAVADDSLYDPSTFAPSKRGDRMQMAQQGPTTTVQTSAPITSTTVVKGGDLAAQIISWLQVAFGGTIGTVALYIFVRGLNYIGIKITEENKSQLQGIIVNGINAAAAKAETQLRGNPNLDINVKSQIIADAVGYAQDHGAEVIRALGLDPKSGEAVEAINARIQTALNDPTVPTPATITPATGMPQVSKVIVNGAQAQV